MKLSTLTILVALTAMRSLNAQELVLTKGSTKLEAERKGGTDIGGGNNGSNYTATWCKNESAILRNFRDRAVLKIDNTGNYTEGNKILKNGIVQALGRLNPGNESFLAKGLARGLEISRNLEATSAKNPERKAMVNYNILVKYYNFILDTSLTGLDQDSYSSNRFEIEFVEFAKNQLTWVVRNLTVKETIRGKTAIMPVGDTKSVVKVAIIQTKASADDLEESLFSYRYSCTIAALRVLHDTLVSYDQGNRDMFDDEKQAVDYLANELERISSTIHENSSCH